MYSNHILGKVGRYLTLSEQGNQLLATYPGYLRLLGTDCAPALGRCRRRAGDPLPLASCDGQHLVLRVDFRLDLERASGHGHHAYARCQVASEY